MIGMFEMGFGLLMVIFRLVSRFVVFLLSCLLLVVGEMKQPDVNRKKVET